MDVTVDTTPLRQFADWVRDAARKAGYDIDSPRGGGKKRLAQDTGMSDTSVSRMLAGERMPDMRFLAPLAAALRVPLTKLLIETGIFPAETLTQGHIQSLESHPITPDEVADSWKIRDEAGRQLVRAMYDNFQKDRQAKEADEPPGSAEAQ